ncbi:hypothetical protein NP493_115g02005 [Ridgeia piscesae]|uniref:CTLH domain-containing protein n=1 Tax=Ridgeia piscesae TaxID=27915 RepID=A0AAD9P6V4_RIDPI|nr:hypothetical protein NP493_115g02005 [Ridgeia piscesae]
MLFLRQLILDGQWDDVLDFIRPLSSINSFDLKRFQYLIYKHKYLELLCIKAEPGPLLNYEVTVDEIVKCLNNLEQLCATKEEYSNLCLLLTLTHLSNHDDYSNWNPSIGRVQCFKDVQPLVEMFLPSDKRSRKSDGTISVSKNDRLVQLLIKGILYESCVDYCQHKATSTRYDYKDLTLSPMLNGTGFCDADLSLLSWLEAVSHDAFCCPFEQKQLNIDVKHLEKPVLEASWSEQILVTPIKPKMFPHSAISATRPRSADFMSRSLNPQYDGLAYGLSLPHREADNTSNEMKSMSRSFAGFHLNSTLAVLNNPSLMTTSVDKLFEGGILNTQSSLITDDGLPTPSPVQKHKPPPHSDVGRTPPLSPKLPHAAMKTSTPYPREKASMKSPCHTRARSASPRHSLVTSNGRPSSSAGGLQNTSNTGGSGKSQVDMSQELYKEYQKQRQQLQEQLAEQEQRRMVYQKQLEELEHQSPSFTPGDGDNRLREATVISPVLGGSMNGSRRNSIKSEPGEWHRVKDMSSVTSTSGQLQVLCNINLSSTHVMLLYSLQLLVNKTLINFILDTPQSGHSRKVMDDSSMHMSDLETPKPASHTETPLAIKQVGPSTL